MFTRLHRSVVQKSINVQVPQCSYYRAFVTSIKLHQVHRRSKRFAQTNSSISSILHSDLKLHGGRDFATGSSAGGQRFNSVVAASDYNDTTVEKAVVDLIVKHCKVPVTFNPVDGALLVGRRCQQASAALKNPSQNSIYAVPIDFRDDCKMTCIESMSRNVLEERVPLLCSADYKGAGKTTLQGFNFVWFLEARKANGGGIAIETTFNDDQQGLWKSSYSHVMSSRDLELAVAVRVLDRVLEYLGSIRSLSLALNHESELVKLVTQLSNPLVSALRITRTLLKAPPDTPIMLGVDELSKAEKAGAAYTSSDMLSNLCWHLDGDESLFLTVTAYGTVDLARLTATSNRRLLVQTLGPLYHNGGMDANTVHLLPHMLQPFFNKSMRDNLPFEAKDVELYQQLSQWYQQTGGHPRRVGELFRAMKQNFQLSDTELSALRCREKEAGLAAGKAFVQKVRQWMSATSGVSEGTNAERARRMITSAVEVPCSFGDLAKMSGVTVAEAVEALATDAARAFVLTNAEKLHRVSVEGSAMGYCQLMKSSAHSDMFRVYIPMVVLNACHYLPSGNNLRNSNTNKLVAWSNLMGWGPRARALFGLQVALHGYQKVDSKRSTGEGLEKVAAVALLLYARSNEEFSLRDLCAPEHCGTGMDEPLLGGDSIELLDIDMFSPSTAPEKALVVTSTHIADLFRSLKRLSSTAAGYILTPTVSNQNLTADVYGLFRKKHGGNWVLVTIQTNDWHCDPIRRGGREIFMEDSWRERQAVFPDSTIEGPDSSERVDVAHILFSANDPARLSAVKANEGVGTFKTMRRWLPTAAYGCEVAHRINPLFAQQSD